MIERDQAAVAENEETAWPHEVDMILSAMDAVVAAPSSDRRLAMRNSYRTRASLKLYADRADAAARTLFTRDADPRCAGFITQSILPLGYGGWVTMVAPNGEEVHAECTVYRCRKTVQGWFEGAMRFNREVWQFAGNGDVGATVCRGLRIAE